MDPSALTWEPVLLHHGVTEVDGILVALAVLVLLVATCRIWMPEAARRAPQTDHNASAPTRWFTESFPLILLCTLIMQTFHYSEHVLQIIQRYVLDQPRGAGLAGSRFETAAGNVSLSGAKLEEFVVRHQPLRRHVARHLQLDDRKQQRLWRVDVPRLPNRPIP